MPDKIDGEVLIALGDDVSTGDLTPDGVVVMALRSNVEAIADFTLRRFDRTFAARAREKGGGFIVAGHNYGQGSSREHAALAPKALGVRGVVAKSFARIHRRNLIAQGIPPLTFVSEGDRDRVRQGDRLDLSGLRDALGAGVPEMDARLNGEPLRLRCAFSARESEVLRAGGLLAWLKQGGAPLSVGVAISALADQGSPITNPSPQDETVR
jgi:aconitate hydratase